VGRVSNTLRAAEQAGRRDEVHARINAPADSAQSPTDFVIETIARLLYQQPN
jgi:hypothetical protein